MISVSMLYRLSRVFDREVSISLIVYKGNSSSFIWNESVFLYNTKVLSEDIFKKSPKMTKHPNITIVFYIFLFMKLFTFYTEKNESLLYDWFLPSIKDDFEVYYKKGEQGDSDGIFFGTGWILLVKQKIDFLIEALQLNIGKCIVFSDVDVQFLAPVMHTLEKSIENMDICFQLDSPQWMVCSGFFVCRANSRTLQFWISVRTKMMSVGENKNQVCDQIAANSEIFRVTQRKYGRLIPILCHRLHLRKIFRYLYETSMTDFDIRWNYLPSTIFGWGTFTANIWHPGDILPIPNRPQVHHANYAVGIENKIAQMKYVKNFLN